MTIVVDASAIVSLATSEADAAMLSHRLAGDRTRLCCPTGVWEASAAVARKRGITVVEAHDEIVSLLEALDIALVPSGEDDVAAALHAYAHYGRGTGHRAQLNMGDCFAYACARTNAAKLLYKGDDFVHTDLA